MIEVPKNRYQEFVALANNCKSNRVYPLSIAEGYQSGEIFTDSLERPGCALFWHYCGFAYLSGQPDATFLAETAAILRNEHKSNPRRFVLEVADDRQEAYFSSQQNIVREQRYVFDYPKTANLKSTIELPEGFSFSEITADLLSRMQGTVIPSFSWDSYEDFLNTGKGYCILHNGEVAAEAFTAAISHDEIDIGIETNERYRRQGLATAAAKRMIQYVLEEKKMPVWQCYYKNTGSYHTAEHAGFHYCMAHSFYKIG